jgi:hypothetical protein
MVVTKTIQEKRMVLNNLCGSDCQELFSSFLQKMRLPDLKGESRCM